MANKGLLKRLQRTIRKEAILPDLPLLSICVLLLLAGILILASVSASFSLEKTGTTFYFFNHQLLFGLIPGLILAAIAYLTPLSLIRKLSIIGLLANIILLAMVFLPVVGTTGG
ncbi:MAG: FtsW/RodA/SpoVE family cell cycle protein, partial [archaeon]|nr:FtsW/RodA/SpoVE family cell cycle protein [archaeon]